MSKATGRIIKSVGSTVLIAVAVIFGMPFLGIGAANCMGYNDMVMGRLRACPQAQELLGSDIGPAYVGMSCGNAETEGSFGHASWRMPVRGSKARGTYQFAVEKRGGGWQMMNGTLTVGGQSVNIGGCAPGSGGGMGGAITAQALQGTVASVTGTSPVPQGSPCSVAVTPVSAGPFNCRVQVQCGGQVVYGGGQSGFTNCTMQPGTAGVGVRAHDSGMTPTDGDPSLDLQAGNSTAMVSDQGPSGMWMLNIALSPPAGAAAPTPMPGVPIPGVPIPGVPIPGVPTPGVPTPAVPTPGVPAPSAWAGTAPLVCTGAQEMTITGQTVTLEGVTAITATGNCRLTLVNCTIRALHGLSASGNAQVVIQGGRIEGSQTSIGASGNAVVTVQGAEVVGRVQRSGGARIEGVD